MDRALVLFDGRSNRGEAQELLGQSRRVWLRLNDEDGEWMWAVESDLDREFWFNAFLTRDEAERWCKEVGLDVADPVEIFDSVCPEIEARIAKAARTGK